VALAQLSYADSWVGHRVSRLEQESGVRVAFLTRYGEGLLPDVDTVVQADDLVHVLIDPSRRADHAAVFARGPEVH
jgi:trk system potassium uptake protein TrkA